MRKKAMTWATLAALLAVAATVTRSEAVLVENVTKNSTLFYDDFESGVVGNLPGVNDPTIGTWDLGNFTAPSIIEVTNAAAESGFNALQGDQYLQLVRNGGTANTSRIDGVLKSGFVSDPGDSIRFSYAFRSLATGSQFGFLNENNQLVLQLSANRFSAGNTDMRLARWNGSAFAGQDIIGGAFNATSEGWTTLAIEYVNGASDGKVSINGGPQQTFTLGPNVGNVSAFFFRTGDTPADWYLDAVSDIPEPSAISLLLAGGSLLMLRIKSRRD